MKKLILDLCGGTGSWSNPYKDAGYDVYNITLPEYDVLQTTFTYKEIQLRSHPGWVTILDRKDIYGILAAPPCTMFSLARTKAKKPRDLEKGMQVVRACMDVIWYCHPKFWVMENPKGLLRQFMGKPAFEFDASEFGCDYNKHTDLWGYFKEPKKTHHYHRYPSTTKNVRKLPEIPKDYNRDWGMTSVQVRRSISPAQFANAFYKANR